MVKSPVVCSLESTTIRPRNWGIKFLKNSVMHSPQSSSLHTCILLLYHLSCVIVVHTSLVLKNNLNTWTRDYVIGTGGHKCATIFCPNSFRLVTDMHLRRRGGWTFIWGNAQIIGQYFPLPEVGTPPPHNSGKVYWPVARNVHTKYS